MTVKGMLLGGTHTGSALLVVSFLKPRANKSTVKAFLRVVMQLCFAMMLVVYVLRSKIEADGHGREPMVTYKSIHGRNNTSPQLHLYIQYRTGKAASFVHAICLTFEYDIGTLVLSSHAL